MAKFTWTEFSAISGDEDPDSPFEESELDPIKQNHKVLLSSPFTFVWYEDDVTGGDRDSWSEDFAGPSWAQRSGGGWDFWIHPGAERLVLSVFVKVGLGGTVGDARMRMQIEGPLFQADDFDDAFINNISSTTPVVGTFTFTKPDLEKRWGRHCSVKVAVRRDSGSTVSNVSVIEDPNPRSFWEQAI